MTISERVRSVFPAESGIPEEYRLAPLEQTEYLVGGEIRRWDGPRRDVHAVVCLESPEGPRPVRIGSYPLLTARESEAALAAAVAAWDHGRGEWPTLSVEERIRRVEDFVFRMQEVREEVVKLLMWEIGKNRSAAAKEFDRTVEYVRDTIQALKELDRAGSRFAIQDGIIAQIRRAPLGVTLCMGPFNYPLNETFTTLIPALIMGNPVIFKPPKLGVLLHRPLLEAFRDAFPPGVVNSIYGDGAEVVGPLMTSGKIDVLAFIGSCRVANILKKQHPYPHHLRSVLGLGAKNPCIILPDADLEMAVREAVLGSLSYNGQRCTALKILFVHKKIAEPFVKLFAEAVGRLRIGMPWEDADITPLPEPGKPERLAELVRDAVEKGARVANEGGGEAWGTFFNPAVVYPVAEGMRLWEVEQFGPVVPIATFEDIREPIDYVTRSKYGQQASLFGSDPDVIADILDPLVNQVCRVNINSQCQRGPDVFPFAGRKDSAEGTLSVSDALRVFSIRTLAAAKDREANRKIISAIIKERKSKFLSTDFIF